MKLMQVREKISANNSRAERPSCELRHGSGEFLEQRRAILGLTLFSMGAMGLIALYQTGVIDHVPEPDLPHFDADRVNGSAEAYRILNTPDAVLGLASYAVTAGLTAMGGKDRAQKRPWLPLALAGKSTADLANAARLTRQEIVEQRTLCLWCLLSTAATVGAWLLSLPEAQEALRTLRRNSSGIDS